jgi:PAS domain S-box-containing protein
MSDRASNKGYPSNDHKILVVEDNQDHMEIISNWLHETGYQVAQAVNGVEALESYRGAAPDLILLDALLPRMDGFETCQNIRSLPGGDKVPVIFMTTLEDEDAVERVFEVGTTDYVAKPIQWSVLQARIRNLLKSRQAEQRFQNLAESAIDGIVSVDHKGIVRYANPAVEDLFGYSAADLVGQELFLLMAEEFRGIHRAGIKGYIDTRQPKEIARTIELRGLRKSGDEFPMALSLSVTETAGELSFTGIIRDISERVRHLGETESRQAYLEAVLQAAPDAILTIDRDNLVQEWNLGAERLFSYSPDEAIGTDVDQLVAGPDPQRLAEASRFTKDVEQGIPRLPIETIRFGKNNNPLHVIVAGAPIMIHGEYHGSVAVYTDISTHHQAEIAIRESRNRYQQIFENTGVSLWVEDFSHIKTTIETLKTEGVTDFSNYLDSNPDFLVEMAQSIRIVDVNQSTLKMLKAETKDALLGSLEIIFVPETTDILRDEIIAIANGETYFEGETINRTLEGDLIHILITIVFPEEAQKFDEVLVSAMDITRRVQAEKKFTQENHLLETLLETIPDNIFFKDREGRFIRINQALIKDFGADHADQILGKTDFDFFPEEHANKAYQDEQRILETGQPMIGEIEGSTWLDGGGEKWASTTKLPLRDETGKIIGSFGVARDITQLIHLGQETQERADRMAQLASISEGLSRPFTEAKVIEVIGQGAMRLSGANRAAVYLPNPEGEATCPWSYNLSQDYISRVTSQAGDVPRIQLLNQTDPLIIPDTDVLPEDLLVSQLGKLEGYKSVTLWPLVYEDQVVAAFACYYDQPHTWTPAEQETLLAFSRQAAVALENARLIQQEQHRRKELERLYRASESLQSTTKPDAGELAQAITETVLMEFDQSNCSVILVKPNQNKLERIAVSGPFASEVSKEGLFLDRPGLVAMAIKTGKIVNEPDVSHNPDYIPNWADARSEIAIPLMIDGRIIGVIDVQSKENQAFNQADERLLSSFGKRAALALVNAQLFDETQQQTLDLTSLNEQLQSLNITLEERVRQRTYELQVLHELSQEISYTLEYEELFRRMLSHLHRIVDYDVAMSLLVDGDQPQIYQRINRSLAPEVQEDIQTQLIETFERMNNDRSISRNELSIRTLEPLAIDKREDHNKDETPITKLNSIFHVPLIMQSKQQIVGVLVVGGERKAVFSEDSVRLLYTLATQASISLERLRMLMDVEQQRLESLVERIPDGVVLIDKTKKVLLVNPTGKQHLDRLADLSNDHSLTHLGDQEIETLLEQREDGLPHTINTNSDQHQIFEIDSRSIDSGPEVGGWVLTLRDVTWERDLLAAEKTRRQEMDSLYRLSRILIATDNLYEVTQTIAKHSVESVSVTFSRVILFQNGEFRCLAAYRIREFDDDLGVNQLDDEVTWPIYHQVLSEEKPSIYAVGSESLPEPVLDALMHGIAQQICLVPLKVGDKIIGILTLGEARRENREPFDDYKLRLASAIGDQSAGTIHRASLHQQTEQQLRRFTALREIDSAITSSIDIRIPIIFMLDQIRSLLKVDATDVLQINPYAHILEYIAGRGFHTKGIEELKLRVGEGFAGQIANEHKLIQISNMEREKLDHKYSEVMETEGFRSYLGIPLIARGVVKGVLEIYHRSKLHVDKEWLDFVETLAGQAAIAIDNSEMFNDLQKSNIELVQAYDATIEGWARALEYRDIETEGHSRRVVELTTAVAENMGFRQADLVHIRRGALLHDIGKMGIPDRILQKPGKLTEDEWTIMKTHPVLSFELLAPIQHLGPAIDIPHYHHERWDGTGYPTGLKAEQIPLGARIFAVVDVWDALRSDRPYRKAWSKEKTIDYILEQSGKHFDPAVVDSFLKLINSNKMEY